MKEFKNTKFWHILLLIGFLIIIFKLKLSKTYNRWCECSPCECQECICNKDNPFPGYEPIKIE